jgi:hypothetical protein
MRAERIRYLDALLSALGLADKVRRGGALYLRSASLSSEKRVRGGE